MVLYGALAWLGCVPTNRQQLQSTFNNSMETSPTLKRAPFGFLVLSYSRNCSRLLTSMVQYFCDSFGLLWLSELTNKCVCWKWCVVRTARWILFGWDTISIRKRKPLAVSTSLARIELSLTR